MKPLAGAVIAAIVLAELAVNGQAVFRSNADEVLVDVSVMRGKSSVAGLTATDFVVTDNGIRQVIRDVSRNSGAIDVTLVIQREAILSEVVTDRDGHFAGVRNQPAARAVDDAAEGARRLIRASDGLRVLTADAEVMSRHEGSSRSGRSTSSILDGLTAAMMLKPTAPGRRQLIIGITGGTDNRSFVPAGSRLSVALRTDAVTHIIALGQGRPAFNLTQTYGNGERLATVIGVGIAAAPLKPIADATGGRLYQVEPGSNIEKTLGPALEEFRTRYLLRYVPTGVAREGWHDIVVTVPSGSFDVRHRRGYEVR